MTGVQYNLFDGISNEKFPQYHKDNPHIYEKFKETTLEAISIGHKRFSAEFIFNIIRWKTPVAAKGDTFKINNNFKAFYSRMFMNEHPQYKGYFETRKSKYDATINQTI